MKNKDGGPAFPQPIHKVKFDTTPTDFSESGRGGLRTRWRGSLHAAVGPPLLVLIWPVIVCECVWREAARCWRNAYFMHAVKAGHAEWVKAWRLVRRPNGKVSDAAH